MKKIQLIATLDLTNDEYSLLLNKESGLTIETLVSWALENGESFSFDFPALLLDLPTDE